LYENDATIREAEKKRVDFWSVFVGADDLGDESGDMLIYRYLYNRNGNSMSYIPRSYSDYSYSFGVLPSHSQYFFSPGEWTLDMALYNVTSSEDGISYVKNWFGIEQYVALATYIDFARPYENIGPSYYLPGLGFIRIPVRDGSPTVGGAVHESVHAMVDFLGLETNFPAMRGYQCYFEEGLAGALVYLFATETTYQRYATDLTGSLASHAERLEGFSYLDYYSRLVSETGYGPERMDAVALLDVLAIYYLKLLDYDFSVDHFSGAPEDAMIRIIEMFQTSADFTISDDGYIIMTSFVLYLISTENTEGDFLRVYSDISLMEEYYGKDIYGMFMEWYMRLHQFI